MEWLEFTVNIAVANIVTRESRDMRIEPTMNSKRLTVKLRFTKTLMWNHWNDCMQQYLIRKNRDRAQTKCNHTYTVEVNLSHSTDYNTKNEDAMQWYCNIEKLSMTEFWVYTWLITVSFSSKCFESEVHIFKLHTMQKSCLLQWQD